MTNNGWLASVWVSSLDNGGADTIEVTDQTPLTPPAAGELRLVAPLRWTETIDDQLWPAQPRGFWRASILANTALELAGVARRDYFTVGFIMDRAGTVFPPFGDVPFDVLATGLVESAVMRPHDLGMVLEVTGVDFRVGYLGEATAGSVAYPSEAISARLVTLLGATPFNWFGPGFSTDPNLDDRDPSRSSKLDLLERWLAGWVEVDGSAVPTERAIIRAVTTETSYVTDGHALDRWEVLGQPKAVDATDAITLDAAYVDFSAEWTQRVNGVVTRVIVEYPSGGGALTTVSASTPGTEAVSRSLSADVTSPVVAQRIANLYLPDAAATPWYADTFRYRLSHDPQTKPPIPRVGQVVTIDGIPPEYHPEGGTTWGGQVVQSDLTVDGGQAYVDFTLRPVAAATILDGGDTAAAAHSNTIDGGNTATAAHSNTIDGGDTA